MHEFCNTEPHIGSLEEHRLRNSKFHLTVVVPVKDQPGGLWEVLNTIGVSVLTKLVEQYIIILKAKTDIESNVNTKVLRTILYHKVVSHRCDSS